MPATSPPTFDEARASLSDHLVRLADALVDLRGPMVPPEMDLSAPACKDHQADQTLAVPDFPHPTLSLLGHVERLLVAVDDQVRCISHLLIKEEPSWFGHLSVIRAAVEAASRCWYLADPTVDAVERVRRFANERIYELNHAGTMLGGPLSGLPAPIHQAGMTHVLAQRQALGAWAAAHGVSNPGGYLGAKRPGPVDLLVQIYEVEGGGIPDVGTIGAWQYSAMSAVAHALPDGMTRYLVEPTPGAADAHPHLVLSTKDLGDSIEPLLTVLEAMTHRIVPYFRWPIPPILTTELTASRLYINRSRGII